MKVNDDYLANDIIYQTDIRISKINIECTNILPGKAFIESTD